MLWILLQEIFPIVMSAAFTRRAAAATSGSGLGASPELRARRFTAPDRPVDGTRRYGTESVGGGPPRREDVPSAGCDKRLSGRM